MGGTKFIWQLNLSALGRETGGGLRGGRSFCLFTLECSKTCSFNFDELQLIPRINQVKFAIDLNKGSLSIFCNLNIRDI